MSVIINVDQHPLTITPTNGEHVYTLSSTGYTLTDFKYVIDIYFQPQTENTLKARLKVRPNSYGKAIFDVGEIVRTFLKVNPRVTGTTYPYLNYVADENHIITLADARQTRDYNAYNLWAGGSPNANLDQLWHVEQYQCVVGCEYTSGSTTVIDIDPNASFQPPYVYIFPGVDNKTIPSPDLNAATLGFGYNGSSNFFQMDTQGWYYYDLFRHVYAVSGDCNCVSYRVLNPDPDFTQLVDYVACDGLNVRNSVPADDFIEFCACEGSVQAGEMFVLTGDTCNNGECGPKEFLNAAGNCKPYITIKGKTTNLTRRRKHHRQCPIILSFLNGKNDYFTNDIYSIAVYGADTMSSPYTYSGEIENRITTTLPILNEDPNSIFRTAVFYLPYNITKNGAVNVIDSDVEKVAFFGTTYHASANDRLSLSASTTEVLEFEIQPDDCLAKPVHLLFLNANGMWDTYTMGGKSTEQLEVDRKKYRQETSLNKQYYARGSSNRGTTIYEQDANYTIKATSWWMDECEKEIMEEIFMSPEVYMIEGVNIEDPQCPDCLGSIRLYQYLTPVVILDKNFEVYEKKYQKLYQYTFTLEYSGLKRFRTQG